MVLDLVTQVAGENVEQFAATDVALRHKLAHIPLRAGLAIDILLAEMMHASDQALQDAHRERDAAARSDDEEATQAAHAADKNLPVAG